MKNLAILPGSFDPMTLGHLELVRRAAKDYAHLVIAVMVNPDKETRFTPEERVEIARRTVAEFPQAEVLFDGGLLIDLYDRLGADAVVKGYRDGNDLAYERKMAAWNRAHNRNFRTVLLRSEGPYASVSSTEVRRRLDTGGDIRTLVHPAALELVEKKRGGRERR